MFDISPLLQDKALEISEKGIPGFFSVQIRIYSKTNEDFLIVPEKMEDLIIEQMFSLNYMDIVRLGLLLEPQQLLDMVNNYKDLMCSIELHHMNSRDSSNLEGVDPIFYEYKVVLNSPSDILKKYSLNEIIPRDESKKREHHMSAKLPITLELFAEKAYDLRHKQFNFLAKNVTIKNLLLLVASNLGVENTVLTEPDNTITHEQIPIPPMHDISSVFSFIHKRYGIYSKGMTYYVDHEGTLYLYPESDTDTKNDEVLHMYSVMENSYSGLETYHYTEDDQTHMVLNTKAQMQNLGEISIENNGSSKISLRSDNILDQNRTVDNGNDGKFRDDNLVSVGVTTSNKASESVANVKYTKSSNNIYYAASELCVGNITLATTKWTMAVPYTLKPGMKVIYYYEDQEGIRTTNGILDSVIYRFSAVSVHGQNKYVCEAIITSRLKQGEEE